MSVNFYNSMYSDLLKKIKNSIAGICSRYLFFRRMVLGSTIDEMYWSRRKISDTNDWNDDSSCDWIESYWNSQTHPHRKILIDTIEKYHPVSVLEIGCNCGPNLCILAKKHPDIRIVGIDINPDAVARGKDFFLEQGITNVTLLVNKADNLAMFQDSEFDVVFTDAVLIYVGPDKIMKVLKEIVRITKKSAVLLEWHAENISENGGFLGHWVHDYTALIRKISSGKCVKTKKISGSDWPDAKWTEYGHIIEISDDVCRK